MAGNELILGVWDGAVEAVEVTDAESVGSGELSDGLTLGRDMEELAERVLLSFSEVLLDVVSLVLDGSVEVGRVSVNMLTGLPIKVSFRFISDWRLRAVLIFAKPVLWLLLLSIFLKQQSMSSDYSKIINLDCRRKFEERRS